MDKQKLKKKLAVLLTLPDFFVPLKLLPRSDDTSLLFSRVAIVIVFIAVTLCGAIFWLFFLLLLLQLVETELLLR